MKLILLLFSVFVFVSITDATGNECDPDSAWMEDCNTCVCIDGFRSCSKKLCRPRGKALVERCSLGSRWYKDCNYCFCKPTGVSACTRKRCEPRRPSPSEQNRGEFECKYTTEEAGWKIDRFWCQCRKTNRPTCDRIPDPIEEGKEEIQCKGRAEWTFGEEWCRCVNNSPVCGKEGDLFSLPLNIECTPGSSWTEGCQTCKCTNGRKSCSKNLCRPSQEKQASTCEPGSQWRKECNVCTCTEKGVGMCTLRGCLTVVAKSEPESKDEDSVSLDKHCKYTDEPSRWRKGCNWCTCGPNGVGRCTLRGCIANVKIDLPACEGPAEWREDTKWCKCDKGKAVCKEIPVKSVVNLALLPISVECTEGSSWTESCQICKCAEGKKSCTKNICRPSQVNKASTCKPGSQWRKDCNICSCSDNGAGMCTLRGCLSTGSLAKSVESKEKPISITKDCKYTEEPSRWRKECNWCSCSKTGIGMCSIMGCLPGVVLDLPECEGKAEWKRGEEWCRCVGGSAVCKPLTVVSLSSLPLSVECTEGSSWTESCQTCKCAEGKKSCTKNVCRPSQVNKASTCKPGSQWRKDCNICSCSDKGVGLCTLKGCLSSTSVQRETEESKYEKDCKLTGESGRWRKNCNWCSCGSNGVGACTLRGCLKPITDLPDCEGSIEWKKDGQWCKCASGVASCIDIPAKASARNAISQESDKQCIVGSEDGSFKIDCNWCYCIKGGHSVCSKMLCREGRDYAEKPECTGEVSWKQGNTWCSCENNTPVCGGNPTAQSSARSLAPKSLDVECVSRTMDGAFKRDCNWCNCIEVGLAVCTKILCEKGRNEPEDEPQCEGDISWKRNNEWCTCENDRARCEPIARVQSVSRSLAPISSDVECMSHTLDGAFKRDCNWCNCIEGGLAVCTKILCDKGRDEPENEPQCEGEISWKRDNEWCTCENDRARCEPITEEPSTPGPQPAGKCNPGDTWQESCNTCSCTEKGIAICTLKACETPQAKKSTQLPGKECLPGSRWRKSCNWCTCSQNGNSAMCSQMGCLPGTEMSLKAFDQCDEGSQWKDGSQWCSCAEGKAKCSSQQKNHLRQSLSKPVVYSQRCEYTADGDGWKNECNWCRCSRTEGRSFCTRKRCRQTQRQNPENVECKGTAKWMSDECNWCSCVNGTGSCTTHNCTALAEAAQLPIDTECVTETETGKWRDLCNWCSCRKGKSMCTRKKCGQAASQRIQGESECQGNVKWRLDDCNWCFCDNGKSVCTNKICETKATPRSSACVEGSTWLDICNTCYCRDGEAHCTADDCNTGNLREVSKISENMLTTYASEIQSLAIRARSFETITCSAGSSWQQDCNWCYCEDGKAKCSNYTCDQGAARSGPFCADGSEWMESCNMCVCMDGVAVCTSSTCIATVERQKVVDPQKECTENSRWKESCNWCICSGGKHICDKLGCIESATNSAIQCEGNAEWRKDKCTWCVCNNNQANCTRSAECSANTAVASADDPTPHDVSTKCPLGTRTRQSCNWCICEAGIEICTNIECSAPPIPQPSQDESAPSSPSANDEPQVPNNCQEGNSWSEMNDVCTCTQGIIICSRSYLPVLLGRQSINECRFQDKSWKNDCNSCQCIKGRAACTKKLCSSHHLSSTRSLPELCYLPAIEPSPIACMGFAKKWTYNAEQGNCQQIIYGGCLGTENLFNTESQCTLKCGTETQQRSALHRSSICEESIKKGGCFSQVSRWAYSEEQEKCVHFLYSGCEGNSNNFLTIDQCEETCMHRPSGCDEPTCPEDCNKMITKDQNGCPICICRPSHCPVDPTGKPHCPVDCPIKIVVDPETGCDKCTCGKSASRKWN